MFRSKENTIEAIQNTDLLPPKQKLTLKAICEVQHPVYAKEVENKLNSTTPQISFCLKALMKRGFITREKEGKYVYRPNYKRVGDIIKRYEGKKKQFL
jgi:predicted transcriptional regulator